ncbi:MAG: NADH:flavin oxidoreductase [Gulosibacter sp.]|uniref:NADH:flavin oxidoreductase n=1 Tax=Gulosibacter sp. TaxID=2817531 RepID=UPI003F9212ED
MNKQIPSSKTTVKSSAEIVGEPLRINTLELKNRFILGPMAILQPTKDGRPSPQSFAFLKRRAMGGVSLVFVGGSSATERAWNEAPFHPNIRLDKDEFLPDLVELGKSIHQEGAAIFGQLFPSFGRMGVPRNGQWPIAASPVGVTLGKTGFPDGVYVPGGRVTPPPKEATEAEIKELERAVVDAAKRVQAAGWDGVEIAAHMCYFYSSFLSPLANKRTDEYGGSTENRARALRDTVVAVREAVGPEFPVGIRMSVNDHAPGGQDEKGFAEVAAHIASAGVDFFSLTDANYESMGVNVPSTSGNMLTHGEPQAFREALGPDVRLFLSSTPDPDQAAAAISAGHVDATMLARQLLADPDYPNKVIQGRTADIVWAERDNGVMRALMTNIPIVSKVNPELGREDPSGLVPTLGQRLFVRATGNRALMTIADLFIRTLKRVKKQPVGPMH